MDGGRHTVSLSDLADADALDLEQLQMAQASGADRSRLRRSVKVVSLAMRHRTSLLQWEC